MAVKFLEAGTALPAKDAEKLRSFYQDTLGCTLVEKSSEGGFVFEAGSTRFYVFPSSGKASGDHTQMMLRVDDLEAAVDELTGKGVTFEQYDFPGFKTNEKGIADIEGQPGAWFKDPEGNLIAISKDFA